MNVAHHRVHVMPQEILESEGPQAHRFVFTRQKRGIGFEQFLFRQFDGKELDDVMFALIDRDLFPVAPDGLDSRCVMEAGFIDIDPGFSQKIPANRFDSCLSCKSSAPDGPVALHRADVAFC